MKLKKSSAIAISTVLSLALAGCGLSGKTSADSDGARTVVIAHTGPQGNSVHNFFELFGEELGERSDGAFKVEVHPAGELGGDQQLVEGLRIGSVDIASAASSNMSAYTDAYVWADLPYVFADDESAAKVWSSELAEKMSEQVNEDVGTHVLAYLNAGGFRVLANKKREVRSSADLAGLKIRTTDAPLEAAITRAWGANPTPVAWADTFSAVQQGVVDGLQLQPEWLNLNGFGTVVKHATTVQALMAFHVVQVSDTLWASLSEEERELLTEAAADAAATSNAQMSKDYQVHLEALEADGVALYEPTPDELAALEEAGRTTWDTFEDQDLLEQILAVQGS